jgi:hypothetical protein
MKIMRTETAEVNKSLDVSGPQDDILNSLEQFNLYMSGAGGGKTHTMALLAADFTINYPQALGLVAANTHEQLNKATLKRIFDVWYHEFKWQNGVHYVTDVIPPRSWPKLHVRLKDYHNTISFSNGALLFLASLDNYKAIDGQEICYALLDETKDTKEEAVSRTIVWRLRQKALWITAQGEVSTVEIPGAKAWNPLYIFTSPAKEEWLNKMFGLQNHYEEINRRIHSKTDYYTNKEGGRCVVIGSTYHNLNLDPEFLASRVAQYKDNPSLMDTYIYGSPIAKGGGEFYSSFNRSIHVGSFPFIPGEAIHLTSDQNVVPYFTLLVAQIFERQVKGHSTLPDGDYWVVRFVNEFCMKNPRNNMEDACLTFEQYYKDELTSDDFAGLFFYGDASGKNRQSINSSTIRHHYHQLQATLANYLHSGSNRVAKKNASVTKRRDFIKKIHAGGYNIIMEIHERCEYLIADLEFTKEDRTGAKDKKTVEDPETKQKYQKHGHTSDAHDYLFVGGFEDYYRAFLKLF